MAPGTYVVKIASNRHSTGDYQFQLLDLHAASVANYNKNISFSMSPGNETNRRIFSANAGDKIFFDSVSATITNAGYWRLIDPDGDVVFTRATGVDGGYQELTKTGTYTVLVEGKSSSQSAWTFNYKLTPVYLVGTSLTLGQTTSDSISVSGEQDVYSFTLTQDAFMHFDPLTDDYSMRWSLYGPNGVVNNTTYHFTAYDDGNNDDEINSKMLLELLPGSYSLLIEHDGTGTGAYSFVMRDLLTETISSLATDGSTNTGSLNPANGTSFHEFTATAGDTLSFTNTVTSGSSAGYIRLLDPDGVVVLETGRNNDFVQTLNKTGTYLYLVEGEMYTTVVSNYNIEIETYVPPGSGGGSPTVNTAALTIGTSVANSVAVNEIDEFTFTLASAKTLYFDARTSQANLEWTLTSDTNGDFVINRKFTQSNAGDISGLDVLLNLPADDYTLSISNAGSTTLSYNFNLLDLASATSHDINTSSYVSGDLNSGSSTDIFYFSATAGDIFNISSQDVGGSQALETGLLRLVEPNGNVVLEVNYDANYNGFVAETTGTYYLLLEGDDGSNDSEYEFTVYKTGTGGSVPSATSLTLDQTPVIFRRQVRSICMSSRSPVIACSTSIPLPITPPCDGI
ncbi:MAG: hypothetical protein R3C11_24290 [Planctomycetaceae bacterium]